MLKKQVRLSLLLYIYLNQHFVFNLVLSKTTHVQYKLLHSVSVFNNTQHIPCKGIFQEHKLHTFSTEDIYHPLFHHTQRVIDPASFSTLHTFPLKCNWIFLVALNRHLKKVIHAGTLNMSPTHACEFACFYSLFF